MTSLSFISPKSFLVKIADIFNGREGFAPAEDSKVRTMTSDYQENSRLNKPVRSKLNISLDDLKTISTALLHYRRNLAKLGEMEKAESVAGIDKKFYELILEMEALAAPQEEFEEETMKVAA